MHKIIKVTMIVFTLLVIIGYGTYSWLTLPPERSQKPVITGIHYIGMTVSNIEKSQALYHHATNLTINVQTPIDNDPAINALAKREGVKAKTSLMKSVNGQLKLMEFSDTSAQGEAAHFVDANGPGIAHVCFQVNQSTDTYAKFLAGGGTFIGHKDMVQVNPKNPVYYAYVRDPDNIMVEIEHVDIEALNLSTPPTNDYRIRHISIATQNMERAINFYAELLETKNPRRAGRLFKLKGEKVDAITGFEQSELEMAWFQVRNLELELIQYYNPAPQAPETLRPLDALGYNMIVFDVSDLALAKTKFLSAGGTLVYDIAPVNDGVGFYGRDLDGNLLGFQSLPIDSTYSATQFKNNGI